MKEIEKVPTGNKLLGVISLFNALGLEEITKGVSMENDNVLLILASSVSNSALGVQ